MVSARPIALVGMMGAGKSTVAGLLAARLRAVAADLDALIEADAGRSVGEIFAAEGEASFRRREAERLAALLDEAPGVVACGGGAILDPGSRARLAGACRVVWLEVSPEEALRRVAGAQASRPLLGDGVAALEGLLADRSDLYAGIAELRIATDGMSPEQVAEAVLAGLGISARRASA